MGFTKTVAVLGAGIQGSCAALALAGRGCRVDLFDRASQPVTQASLWNEGKIHLGLIYARDTSNRTTEMLLRGALHFDASLQRLTGRARPAELTSRPFHYVVHRRSQLSLAAIAAHFEAVAQRYRTARAALDLAYLGHESDFVWEPMSDRDRGALYDDRETLGAFRTIERSVDPLMVAGMLRKAIAEHKGIRFVPRSRVERVVIDPSGRPSVAVAGEGAVGPYEHVVNALWEDRLRVDDAVGLRPGRPWLHRYKLAVHLSGVRGPAAPSTTFLLGEFGDIADFATGRRYLSWYPACKLGEWRGLQPEDIALRIDETTRRRAFDATVAALAAIVPSVGAMDLSGAQVEVEGGYIFAWGRTGIDDPQSELHRRFDIGIQSAGRYHSIDTGKYSMAPYFADVLADRLCGERTAGRAHRPIRQSAEA
ncbi:MAG TPA: FAD-dependent oxidoreductase [Dongiaceae bacterium]|nr:FAD-dependent oxidoreductase [Dongiaceae bacterium]